MFRVNRVQIIDLCASTVSGGKLLKGQSSQFENCFTQQCCSADTVSFTMSVTITEVNQAVKSRGTNVNYGAHEYVVGLHTNK